MARSAWLTHVWRSSDHPEKVMVIIPRQPDADFSIHIYDHNDNLIYSENLKTSDDFAKVFHLKQFDNGATDEETFKLTRA
jgi:hypothetical protein